MSPLEPAYVAVDLGAGSGRVILVRLSPEQFLIEEVHRFRYEPRPRNGRLRWPAAELFDQIKAGLRRCGEVALRNDTSIASVGVDAWGVDYGLVDAAGELCGDPVCYRDSRTEGVMERIFERIPREEIYARTGVQLLRINTLFQLAAHAESGIPEQATRFLLIPDLIHFMLTDRAVNEFTSASTTQMLDVRSQNWDVELLESLGLPVGLLGDIVPAGTDLGPLEPSLARELGLEGVPVVVPATHDTASAVVGTPLEEGFAYISSGTWSLAGVELDKPLVNSETARHNFTNEGGAFDTTRFLKNVMGLWIFESCRKEWSEKNIDVPYDELLGNLDADAAAHGLIYPDDPRFLNPDRMLSAITDQMEETGQTAPLDPAECTKVILDSLAFRYASVIRSIEQLTGNTIRGIHIVGGGSRNDYLNQVTATVSGKPIVVGPVEATAIGNVLVQAIGAGRFETMGEARRYVAAQVELKRFFPRPSSPWDEAAERYAAVESRFRVRS